MLVYRDSRTRVPAGELIRRFERALTEVRRCFTEQGLFGALLHAGELECALWDADSYYAEAAASVTDLLAGLACRADTRADISLQSCQQLLSTIRCRSELAVSRPEGFAYYALHPLDFADLISTAELSSKCAHVIGIRSIGTTLSAVAAARLTADGIPTGRTTVRPEGHPYDRHTTLTEIQRRSIGQAASRNALFLICDEGPGRSGSSLLSVAEALEREGVIRDRIVLLCSHQPDIGALCAPDAAARWNRYRSIAAGMTKRLPQETGQYVGGGEWRVALIPDGEPWPATWLNMERLKFLSADRQKIFKFEGHGPYGHEVGQRQQMLADNHFGARYFGNEAGFGIQQLIGGRVPDVERPTASLLGHMAKYCAWRAESFPATVIQQHLRQLEQMAAHNFEQEFGFAAELHLDVERPAICDARMQPHKWRQLDNERWIKLDASTHGDDHFFPGPTDIAWDLAGICVEWHLDGDRREFFLSEYQRLGGDNPTHRLPDYEIAYTAFRLGWSRMAASSVSGADDEGRLLLQADRYRAILNGSAVGVI